MTVRLSTEGLAGAALELFPTLSASIANVVSLLQIGDDLEPVTSVYFRDLEV